PSAFCRRASCACHSPGKWWRPNVHPCAGKCCLHRVLVASVSFLTSCHLFFPLSPLQKDSFDHSHQSMVAVFIFRTKTNDTTGCGVVLRFLSSPGNRRQVEIRVDEALL